MYQAKIYQTRNSRSTLLSMRYHTEALIDTIGHSITEAIDECIQARFGGVGLPTAIKYLHGGVINHGDLDCRAGIHETRHHRGSDDLSVSRCPVAVVSNCVVHLLFDLTHLVSCLVDFYTIAEDGDNCNPLCATTSTVHLCCCFDETIQYDVA